jgi:hypothetical protein
LLQIELFPQKVKQYTAKITTKTQNQAGNIGLGIKQKRFHTFAKAVII